MYSDLSLADLETRLQRTEIDRERLELELEISERYWQKSEYIKSRDHAKAVIYYARIEKDDRILARGYYITGITNCYLRRYDESLEALEISLQLNKKLGLKEQISGCLNSIGQIYVSIGDLPTSEPYFRESIDISPDFASGYNSLGVLFMRLNKFEESLDYMLRGYELLKNDSNQKSDRGKAVSLINISETYFRLGNTKKALHYANKSLKLSITCSEETMIYSMMNYGNLLIRNGEIESGRTQLLKAMKLGKDHENLEIMKNLTFYLSESYKREGDFENGMNYLYKYLGYMQNIHRENLSQRLSEIQKYYERENEQLKAQHMIEKASKVATIGTMSAAITHEINQPLCAVQVSSDSIQYWKKQRNIEFPDEVEECLTTIDEGIKLINEIVNHVRNFCKPEENEHESVTGINATIQKALGLLECQINSHGIYLDLNLSEEEIEVMVSSVHLEQIIINIVINAVHSLDECIHDTKKIKIESFSQGNTAIIEISDNGTGVPEELKDKIFDPFYTSKKNGKGMGLGLAIVTNYIRKYKGSIKVMDNDHRGAKFSIELPGVNHEYTAN